MTEEIVQAEIAEPQMAGGKSSIELSIGFFPLAFFLFACNPVAEINGIRHQLGWGKHLFHFPPGDYHVRIYFHYLFVPECGKNEVSFRLDPGAQRRVSFYMWPLMFVPGQMSVS